jgi:quercetin dioxygenase-like cupin family protein
MQPFCTVIQKGGGTREDYSHQGEEFGVVLEGALTLKVGKETYRVEAGSSFYYPSFLPHAWTNEEDEPCRVVWVVTPPTW